MAFKWQYIVIKLVQRKVTNKVITIKLISQWLSSRPTWSIHQFQYIPCPVLLKEYTNCPFLTCGYGKATLFRLALYQKYTVKQSNFNLPSLKFWFKRWEVGLFHNKKKVSKQISHVITTCKSWVVCVTV